MLLQMNLSIPKLYIKSKQWMKPYTVHTAKPNVSFYKLPLQYPAKNPSRLEYIT